MTTFDIPQLIPKPATDPKLNHPDQGARIGDQPNPCETTASKKVDDISRHESKHDEVPKQAPRLNVREKSPDGSKPGPYQPQGGKPTPGSVKK